MPLEFDGVNGIVKNTTSDGDVTIKGNDGGSEISALVFDMSAEGAATFNSTVALTSFAATDGCTITTADNDPQLILTSTDADADEGPRMNFVRNSGSPANNDVLARISLQGKDAGANTTSYAELETTAVNVAEGSETGKFNIKVAVAGSVNQDVITMTGSEVVINDSSNDLDFRVESDDNAHMLFVDGGNNRVGIGTTPDLGVGLHIRTGDSSGSVEASKDELVIENSANAGITILSGASSQGAIAFGDSGDNDVGRITYAHSDNSLRFHTNASEVFRIDNAGNAGVGEASPDTRLHVTETIDVAYSADNFTIDANALLKLENPSTTGAAFSAIQFRTGSGADLFFGGVQGSGNEGAFIFGRQGSPDLELVNIAHNGATTITTSDNTDTLSLISTDADASVGPNLRLYRNSSSPADGDQLAKIDFEGRNDNSQDVSYFDITSYTRDVSDGEEDGILLIHGIKAGSSVEYIRIDPHANHNGIVFNDGSTDMDFRVESNANTHMLFVDGGNNSIGINNSTPGSYDGGADDLVVGDHSVSSQGITIASDDNSILYFADGTSGDEAYRGSIIYNHPAENFIIRTGGFTTRMTIDSTGATVVGQVLANGGGVSAPTFAFTTDTNTGMTRPTTDTLTLVTAGTEAMRVTSGQTISTGGTASPDVGVGGIGLSQGANDDPILTFKSSDVAHGMTAIAETDTYVKMLKNSDGGGALNLTTLSETATAFRHIACITGSNTAESTAATSAWGVDARKKNGTSVEGLAADDNLASFRHSDEAQVIFKGDGEIFSNQTATVGTYDAYEDAQLVRAYDLSHMKGVIDSKFDKFVQYNKNDLQKARLIGTDDDGNATPFVNITGMSRLHNGAIWQQYEKHQKLASAFYKLAKKTIGKEEADKLLTEEEIQLLN